jgi:hypothetical protein
MGRAGVRGKEAFIPPTLIGAQTPRENENAPGGLKID